MQEDVEITFTIEGAATDVLADLRALRPSGTHREASIRAVTINSANPRWWQDQWLPKIVEGDATLARESSTLFHVSDSSRRRLSGM
jgi:hypothetical protein